MTDDLPERLETADRVKCGVCGLPIHPSESGVRHFGFYTAHADYRCVELLKSRAETAEQALSASQKEVERLRDALETFAILANDDSDYLPDEHVVSLTYDDSELDADLGGPNTLLGERFMRAFRVARSALQTGGKEHG